MRTEQLNLTQTLCIIILKSSTTSRKKPVFYEKKGIQLLGLPYNYFLSLDYMKRYYTVPILKVKEDLLHAFTLWVNYVPVSFRFTEP